MYLKTVTIHGFKSFAHPVSVEFSPGLNVVVGPNGSGKSNLIDALRWILGERKGGHQVLFHGSAKYRPLGMASVELTFEGDGVPPFRVEKRAFASGETEYLFQGSKIRLGELLRKLAELGLSLHRLEVGFVTNHDLHALADLSPLERLHWLEEASGILEMRTSLARLSRTLQSVVEKRERFRERLREIAFQRARVAEWAEREEEYLRREKRWQSARKAYLTKLLENLRGKLTSLCEEESFCDQELHRLSVEQSLLNLDAEERQLFALQNTLRSLRREAEEGKRSIAEKERELYQLLTEMRGRKERCVTLENRGKKLLEEVRRLEKEKEFLVFLPGTLARLAKTEQVITRFIDERREELRSLKAREQRAREESIRLETMLRSVESEYRRFSREQEKLVQEIESLKEQLATLVAKIQEYEGKGRDLEQRKEDASRRLARIRELLLRVRAKRKEVEVQGMPDRVLEEVRSGLASMGWPNRAVHGLLGFLRTVQVFKGEHVPQESGKWVVPYVFLPPFSQGWATKRREEILSYLQGGRDPDRNLVALDGSVILLKGGFFFFPRRFALQARFLESWERREALFERQAQELERTLGEIALEEKALERQRREEELRVVQWQERLCQKEESKCQVEERLHLLSSERERLLESLQGVRGEIASLSAEIGALQKVLARAEKAARKVQERKNQEEAKRRRYEKFLWEIQRIRKDVLSVVAEMGENGGILHVLTRQLAHCGWELQGLLQAVRAKEALLQEEEGKKELLERTIGAKRHKEKALERQKEKWLRERERLHFAKEKLREEIERVEGLLANLWEFDSPEFQALDLESLKRVVEEEEKFLASATVRRGAIEEYRELESREKELGQQDAFFGELLDLAASEIKSLERGIQREFHAFLDGARKAFSRYFRQIFQGGDAEFAVRDDGVHLEVQIPGKKRQGMALLSSGERTLVALCFLCACFEAKGAQMCFFDEIDANLDHTNSSLLAQILKEFSASRQVVIVTHKEEVMEAADRILGVTMSEPGVSQIIPCESLAERELLRGGR